MHGEANTALAGGLQGGPRFVSTGRHLGIRMPLFVDTSWWHPVAPALDVVDSVLVENGGVIRFWKPSNY